MKEIYQFGKFRLDSAERRLWCGNESVSLTPKQLDLLLYLVENAGRTAKKNELLDAVWADIYIEETTLARNISWLRKKLAEYSNGESFIETVPKLGYRFTAEVTHSDENALIIEEKIITHIRGEEIIAFDETKSGKPQKTKIAKSSNHYYLPSLIVLLTVIVASGFILYRNQEFRDVKSKALEQATELNVKATITIKNITVDATAEAVNVGLKVLPGDVIKISAMGVFQTEGAQNWTFQGDEKGEISVEHTFQNANPWALIGWIGTETDKIEYFQASTNPVFQSKKSGLLYLAVNDLLNKYADNRGGLNVSVILYRQYNIYAEDDDVEMAWGKELVNINNKTDTLEIRSRGNVSYWKNGELYDLDGSNHPTDGHLAPELNARSFIGKIGDNSPFKVGKNFSAQQVKESGWLFLSVNDKIFNWANSFKNNSGEITTDIEISRQQENFKNPV